MKNMLENWDPRPRRSLAPKDPPGFRGPTPLVTARTTRTNLDLRDFRAKQVHFGCNITLIVLTKTKFWNWCEI